MLEALVESSKGGRRTVLQYLKMMSVVALPVAAVIGLVSYTLHTSRVERASQLEAVQQFQVFADIEALETSIRAERGYTTSVVLLSGKDAGVNELMIKQRSHTDEILLNLPTWPEGLAINDVHLTTKNNLRDMLNEFRSKVMTLSVDFHEVLDFYSEITKLLIQWLLVPVIMKFYYTSLHFDLMITSV